MFLRIYPTGLVVFWKVTWCPKNKKKSVLKGSRLKLKKLKGKPKNMKEQLSKLIISGLNEENPKEELIGTFKTKLNIKLKDGKFSLIVQELKQLKAHECTRNDRNGIPSKGETPAVKTKKQITAIKFENIWKKQELYVTRDGLQGTDVFMSEDRSVKQRTLFYQCWQLRKKQAIKQTWTQDLVVNIRTQDGEKIVIHSEADLAPWNEPVQEVNKDAIPASSTQQPTAPRNTARHSSLLNTTTNCPTQHCPSFQPPQHNNQLPHATLPVIPASSTQQPTAPRNTARHSSLLNTTTNCPTQHCPRTPSKSTLDIWIHLWRQIYKFWPKRSRTIVNFTLLHKNHPIQLFFIIQQTVSIDTACLMILVCSILDVTMKCGHKCDCCLKWMQFFACHYTWILYAWCLLSAMSWWWPLPVFWCECTFAHL